MSIETDFDIAYYYGEDIHPEDPDECDVCARRLNQHSYFGLDIQGFVVVCGGLLTSA